MHTKAVEAGEVYFFVVRFRKLSTSTMFTLLTILLGTLGMLPTRTSAKSFKKRQNL